MIVKDEEEMLPSCLESVRGAVDEIIVVDTGSSDRSKAIAQEHGAMVVDFTWCDDFAAARNAGLERASGDWILFLDADEALEATAREQIRSWTAVSGCDGLFLNIHNYTGSGQQGATVNPVLRLFRNAPEHRFKGRIHEQIAAAICERNPEAAFHITDMVIHHYGYQTVVVERKDKVNRNLRLLQQAVVEEPEQPFHHYNLGVEYLRVGEAEQALDSFGKARKMIDPAVTSYAHLLLKYEVRCLEHLQRWQEALGLVDAALELFPEYTDLIHHRAICADALGDPEAAEKSLREAIRQGPPPAIFHTEEGMGTYQTWYTLGRLLEGKADLEGAVDAYVEAVRAKSSLLPPLYRIFRMMRVSGQERQISSVVKSRFSMHSEEALTKVLGILEQCHCYDAALELLEQMPSGSSGEQREKRSVAEAILHVQRGDWSTARLKLETVKRKKGSLAPMAARWLERLQWLDGKEEQETSGQDEVTLWLKKGSHTGEGREITSDAEPGLAGRWKAVAEARDRGVIRNEARLEGTTASDYGGLYDGWQALGLMLEGCVQSGRWQDLHGLIHRGRQLLVEVDSTTERRLEQENSQGEQVEREITDAKGGWFREPFSGASDTPAGTSWLVKGLVRAADCHLAQLVSDREQMEPGKRQRHSYWPVIQRIRLELPGADGFEG
jgi:tetratricopeptide (TPR) repeat protein